MSRIMDEADRKWNLGINNIPDTYVCSNHVSESAIARFINYNSTSGYCNYCKRNKKVVPLAVLIERVMKVVGTYYTDPANFMIYESAEGGYQGNVYTAEEVLQEHLELEVDNSLFKDFYASIDLAKPWADELEYYDSPADTLTYSWDYFKRLLKHRSRYFFNSVKDLASHDYKLLPEQILARIGATIKKFGLIKELPANSSIYRCRQHSLLDESVQTFSGMTSPPNEYAIQPNRMSPAGISMFYGAFDERTAIEETLDRRNTELPHYTIAEFITKEALTIVDLSLIPQPPSVFDLDRKEDYYPLIFLNSFIDDLVSPIKRDEKVHINYVPTQVVTEYLRYPFSDELRPERINGLIYKSSKTDDKACVLFFDNQESTKSLESDPAKYKHLPVQ